MDDLISRQTLYDRATMLEAQALDYVGKLIERDGEEYSTEWKVWSAILAERTAFKHDVYDAPSAEPERKKGKWLEKHHAYSDEESVIEEWQSCKCSECGRYDTRPYLYYFSEPKFCSWCGARMDGGV